MLRKPKIEIEAQMRIGQFWVLSHIYIDRNARRLCTVTYMTVLFADFNITNTEETLENAFGTSPTNFIICNVQCKTQTRKLDLL